MQFAPILLLPLPCPTEMQLNIKGDAVQFLSSKNAPPDYATKGPA